MNKITENICTKGIHQSENEYLKQKKKKHNSKKKKCSKFYVIDISPHSSKSENLNNATNNVITKKKCKNSNIKSNWLPEAVEKIQKNFKNSDEKITLTFNSPSELHNFLNNFKSKKPKIKSKKDGKSKKKNNISDSSLMKSDSSCEYEEKKSTTKSFLCRKNYQEKFFKKLHKSTKYFNLNLQGNSFQMPFLESKNIMDSTNSIRPKVRLDTTMCNQENMHNNNCKINMTNQAKYFMEKKMSNDILKDERLEKKKKKKREKKYTSNKGIDEKKNVCCNDKNVLLHSEFSEKSDSAKTPISTSSNSNNKVNKKLQKRKSLKQCEFPKYLSASELQLMITYGVLISGIIRINKKNYKEAYITAPDKGTDILIEGLKDRNRALEGDEVYVLLKPKEHQRSGSDGKDIQRTGVVVGLKTLNHNRGAVGTLNPIENKNSNKTHNFALFTSRDPRLPRIKIHKKNWPNGFEEDSQSFKNKLLFVKICQWNNVWCAEGKVIKELGMVGDIEAETNAILLKYNLDVTPYDEFLINCIPPSMYAISAEDVATREDLRRDCVFTIDPETAVDLDDAISCKRLINGNYEIGVHISDVSYYLKEGMPLDFVVSKRATTVYLVQRAYHMLPYELCRICSLTPGEDKLSFSVIWEITPELDIISHRFARTVINSCGQFSYEQVQAIIDDLPMNSVNFPKLYGNHIMQQIKEVVLFLHKIAVKLRQSRFADGALRIDQKKIKFSLDDMYLPTSFSVEAREESHRLIEELMLLANMTVAEELCKNFPEIAFLRSHYPPTIYNLKKLQKYLEKNNIKLDISSAGSINASLSKYSGEETKSVGQSLVINSLLAKLMTRARYYCSGMFPNKDDRHHYALNVALYTHFTSPIRRYADVMVHRLLTSLINHSDPPRWTAEHVENVANNCNDKKYAAKMASEDSLELYFAIYIECNGTMEFEAVVCDVKERSFECIILATGTHQRVFLERVNAKLEVIKNDGVMSLILKWPVDSTHTQESIQQIKLFSIVKLELKKGKSLKIEASLVRKE